MRMRDVLLQLALTSNGRTASWDASGSSEADYTPALGVGDAPELYFAAEWDAADSDARREQLLEQASGVLKDIRQSSGDPTRVESRADRDARIVEHGEGLPAREVANTFRCGITDVWRAREEDGRETDYGRRPRNGHELSTDERQAEVERLAGEEGMRARQIANALGLSYSTVLRALQRKA